jgi:diamine N-acetyltransferase
MKIKSGQDNPNVATSGIIRMRTITNSRKGPHCFYLHSPGEKMKIEILQVDSSADVVVVERLAREIWPQHYNPIIGHAQVVYMLEKFQSARAITAQIESGCDYYLTNLDGKAVGYIGLIPELDKRRMMLSKIYVERSSRGQGVGRAMLDFVEARCKSHDLSTLWLTVNRFNEVTIKWYEHNGYMIADEVKKDIGGGFFMDDYLMEKPIRAFRG